SITKAAEMVKADRASSPHKKASAEVTTPVPTKVAVRKASSSVAQKQSKTATKQKSEGHKLFILDTNVLLHDPTCLFRFEEHDIFLPMMALEELDHNKKGLTEVARNARQVSRTLDSLVADHEDLN
ncbi:PIN domain-containing protein, partial [Micrococcus luteus]|nr:PIN domain-containing protein [Micrococcus luteus]